MKASYFFSLLFAALALAPAMAHLLELPNKINLSREDYLTVQQIYRGWALLGFVVAGALLSTLALAITVRHEARPLSSLQSPCSASWQRKWCFGRTPIRLTKRQTTGLYYRIIG
jgi:hypothetical protein